MVRFSIPTVLLLEIYGTLRPRLLSGDDAVQLRTGEEERGVREEKRKILSVHILLSLSGDYREDECEDNAGEKSGRNIK